MTNPKLETAKVAVSSVLLELILALQRKGVLSHDEIDQMLFKAGAHLAQNDDYTDDKRAFELIKSLWDELKEDRSV